MAVGESYNVGGGCERKNIDVVREICRLLASKDVIEPAGGFERLVTFVSDRPGHDARYAMDCGKTVRQLGWRPRGRLRLDCPRRLTGIWRIVTGGSLCDSTCTRENASA